jgi:hypothetical protein
MSGSQGLSSHEHPQAEALRQAIKGFKEPLILRAHIGSPPRGTVRGNPDWLYFTVKADRDFDYVRANWQVDITTGLLRDLSRRRRWPTIGGKTVNLVLRGAAPRWDGSSVLSRAFTGSVSPTSDAKVRATLVASCREAGVELARISFDRPLGKTAVEVDVTVPDAAAFQNHRTTLAWHIMKPVVRAGANALAEGVLLVARDIHGSWIAASSYAVRAASGGSTAKN